MRAGPSKRLILRKRFSRGVYGQMQTFNVKEEHPFKLSLTRVFLMEGIKGSAPLHSIDKIVLQDSQIKSGYIFSIPTFYHALPPVKQ